MKRFSSQYECYKQSKKIKIYFKNKRKAEDVLYGNEKKRYKYIHDISIKCPIHEEIYICDMYGCDGRTRNIVVNFMSYIN